MTPEGVVDTVSEAEHDLRFDGRKLLGGTVAVTFASGATRTIEIEAGRTHLDGGGRLYRGCRGRGDPGADRLELADPKIQTGYDGLYDNACRFRVDGPRRSWLRRGRTRRSCALPAGGPSFRMIQAAGEGAEVAPARSGNWQEVVRFADLLVPRG